MPVAVRGVTQGAYTATKAATVAFPAGSQAGDLAILYLGENSGGSPASKPTASGWKLVESGYAETTWQKALTAADITTGSVGIVGYVHLLQVFSGASKVGRVSESPGVSVVAGGAALFIGWDGPSPLAPDTAEKLHTDVLNPSYRNRPNNAWFRAASVAGYVSWTTSAKHAVALELLPLAAPPAPTLVSPAAASQVNPGAVTTFAWAHQSTRAQAEYRLRLRAVSAATWSYLQADGTLTATETSVASQVQSATLDAAQLTSGTTYEWQVATSDGGLLSAYSAAWQIAAVAPPVVTAITVTSPAGDLTPTIAWTATYGVGGQEAYEARIATSASDPDVGVVWRSGVTAGADLTLDVPAQDWTNGQAQYAWVRVQQSGGLWSAWTRDDVTHTVSWTPPTAPTITATAGTPPTIVVSGVASGNVAQVEAQVAGGAWRTVATVTSTGTSVAVRDPLAAYGVVTTYRARRQADVSGVMMWSGYSATQTLTNVDRCTYLVGEDSTWLAVRVREDAPRTIVQGVAVSYGLDATRPRIDITPEQGEAGKIVLAPRTQADRLALLTWLSGRLVWTVRWGPERETTGTITDVPATRMGPAGPRTIARLAQTNLQHRTITLEWVEQ